jgi:hypothetical protein
MCLAPIVRPEEPAPRGQESIAQGLPWVCRYERFALKGLGMRVPSGAKVWSRFSVAPSGQIRIWGITQGEPWAMFSWPFGPKIQVKPRATLPGHFGTRNGDVQSTSGDQYFHEE